MYSERTICLEVPGSQGEYLDLEVINIALSSDHAVVRVKDPPDNLCRRVGAYAEIVGDPDEDVYGAAGDTFFRGVIAAVSGHRVEIVQVNEWQRREESEPWL